jgi:hypothetical protein
MATVVVPSGGPFEGRFWTWVVVDVVVAVVVAAAAVVVGYDGCALEERKNSFPCLLLGMRRAPAGACDMT